MTKVRIIKYIFIVILLLPLISFAQTPDSPETQDKQDIQGTSETKGSTETQSTPDMKGSQETQDKQDIQGTSETQDMPSEVKKTKKKVGGTQEYRTVKGDTLWGIAKKELNDPFMWPAIWKENPNIKNPRWIYPGQMIKLPGFGHARKEPVEEFLPEPVMPEPPVVEVKQEAKVIEYSLVNENLFIASGYISETIPAVGQVCNCPPEPASDKKIIGVGQVNDSPSSRTLHGNDDTVYINLSHPAKAGDKFYVINISEPVYHPITRDKIGYIVTVKGIIEVVEYKDGDATANVIKSFEEIEQGDILDTYYDMKPPKTKGNFRRPDINGMIIAAAKQTIIQSMLDVIYLDKGCKDGIEPGDMFRTLAVDIHAVPNGSIQVISCKDHTATAIIKSSSGLISPGNIFTKLEKK